MKFNKTSTGYNDNTSLTGLGLQHVVEGATLCGVYKIESPSGKIYIGKSKNILKRISYYKNLTCTSQTRLYYSLKKHGQYKITFSSETKEKMSLIKKGKKQSPEAIKIRSLARTRKVKQIDSILNSLIKIWDSAQEASNTLRINRNSICLCCRGKGKLLEDLNGRK